MANDDSTDSQPSEFPGIVPRPRQAVGGLSRETLLGADWNRDRGASRAAAAIQARILFMRYETRKAIRAFLGDDFSVYTRELDRDYLASIRRQASDELALRAVDFERYVSQWARLIPAQPETASALEALLAQRYGLSPSETPAAFAALHGELDVALAPGIPGAPGDADVPGDVVGSAELAAQWVTLSAGTVLYQHGDAPSAMYLLVNGRIEEISPTESERPEVLRRGQVVGQVEILTGEPRATTAYAARDSELVVLPQDLIVRLAQQDATLMMVVNKQLASRMRERLSGRASDSVPGTIAFVPLHDGVASEWLFASLSKSLARFGSVSHLAPREVDERIRAFGIDPSSGDGVDAPEFVAWLNELEALEQFLLLQVDDPASAWGQRAFKHVDRVVLVANAGSALPGPEFVPGIRERAPHARLDLLLLHPASATTPAATARWLDAVKADSHIHLREQEQGDVEYLARLFARRAVGVVLSGGGARGYAHAGAVRAIIEAGIPVDSICGTSIGALVAAGYASSMPPAEVIDRLRANATRKALIDPTLPVSAVLRGRKVTRVFQTAFGHSRIEDLWRPYSCVSTNLTRARQVVHRRGPLWRAIRASTAIPGIFPPVMNQQGDLLVDGALMNSLPVDVMLEEPGIGTVIAINVTPIHDRERQYTMGNNVDGWQVALRKMLNPRKPAVVPSVFDTLLRANEVRGSQADARAAASLVIEPPMEDFPVLGLSAANGLIDFGYEHGRSAVEEWLETLAASGPLPWTGSNP